MPSASGPLCGRTAAVSLGAHFRLSKTEVKVQGLEKQKHIKSTSLQASHFSRRLPYLWCPEIQTKVEQDHRNIAVCKGLKMLS